MRIREALSVARDYLAVTPASFSDGIRLYYAFCRALLELFTSSKHHFTVGQFLPGSRLVALRTKGLAFYVRPHSDDLGFLSPRSKPAVHRWFHPSPGETVVDVGAHIGVHSMLAAKVGARVTAYEPNPKTFGILTKNINSNRLSNVICRNLAVGKKRSTATLYIPDSLQATASLEESWGPRVANPATRQLEVAVTSLDADLEGVSQVDWLLIDVEGHEEQVLEGAPKTLSVTKQLIIEVSFGVGFDVCRRILSERHGMTLVERSPQSRENEYWLLRSKSISST